MTLFADLHPALLLLIGALFVPLFRGNWRSAYVIALPIAAFLAILAIIRPWSSEPTYENPLAGARLSRLTDFQGTELNAAISPDGKFFAFVSDHDGPFDVWVGQVGSSNFRNRTAGLAGDTGDRTNHSAFRFC